MARKNKNKDIKKAEIPKAPERRPFDEDTLDFVDLEVHRLEKGELHEQDPRRAINAEGGGGPERLDLLKRLATFRGKGKTPIKKAAKGGSMSKQMEMFAEGGLEQEGGSVDPVSGNSVPIGSTKEEVRDDIPAQLSEGEFVMPADVVRFHGLDKMMELRDEAKMGLQRMDDMGQMGNSEEATLPDNTPFDINDLDMSDEEEPTNDTIQMAQGGVVKAAAGTFMNPSTGIGSYQQSQFGNYATPTVPNVPSQLPTTSYIAPTQQATPFAADQTNLPAFNNFIPAPEGKYDEIIEYVNAEGMKLSIPFVDGKPIYPIPTGYTKVDTGLITPDIVTGVPTSTTQARAKQQETNIEENREPTPEEKKARAERQATYKEKITRGKELGYKPINPLLGILSLVLPGFTLLGLGKTTGTMDLAGNVVGKDGRTYDPRTGQLVSSGSMLKDIYNSFTDTDISNTTSDGTKIENTMVTPMTAAGMKNFTFAELRNQINDMSNEVNKAETAQVTKNQFGMGSGAGIDSSNRRTIGNTDDFNIGLKPNVNRASVTKAFTPIAGAGGRTGRGQSDLVNNRRTDQVPDSIINDTNNFSNNRAGDPRNFVGDDFAPALDIVDERQAALSRRDASVQDMDNIDSASDGRTETRDPMQSSQTKDFSDNARDAVEERGGSKGIGLNNNGSTYSENNDGSFTHENGTTVNFIGSDGKPGNPPQNTEREQRMADRTAQFDDPGDDDASSGDSGGCVIATHGLSTGGFTLMEKAKAELWCQKTYHGKWYGEAFRKGYRAAGMKQVNAGTAPNVYQEFKDFVAYGRGIKKGWRIGFNYYLRTLQFFFTGLLIK